MREGGKSDEAKLAHKSNHEIESVHSDTDVLIINTSEDRILVLCDQIGMGRYDFDHREEGNALDCSVGRLVSGREIGGGGSN
jgi:hypothetical protein